MKKYLFQFDGSNFYNRVKKLDPDIHLSKFDYRKFCNNISESKHCEIIYYIGEIKRSSNNQHLYAGQQSLLYALNQQNIETKLGYLLFNNGRFQEKGVDVQIAVDMVYKAANNEYDVCYLISSDTDLIPAIQTAIQIGKKIVYVGFESRLSIALQRICSESIVIDEKIFEHQST